MLPILSPEGASWTATAPRGRQRAHREAVGDRCRTHGWSAAARKGMTPNGSLKSTRVGGAGRAHGNGRRLDEVSAHIGQRVTLGTKPRSEERRVGKGSRAGGSPEDSRKKEDKVEVRS